MSGQVPVEPQDILVIDIETDIPEPKRQIDLCDPFLVGIKLFKIREGELLPGRFCFFEKKDLKKAIKAIRKFPGVIVGYNLLGFDYVVLREHIDIEPLFERTVDLLDYLSRKTGTLRGLKLHKVCLSLLGEGKTLEDARGLSGMWIEGKRAEVLRYNERDCDLTARLWLHLMMHPSISVLEREIQITKADRDFLQGKCPVLTHNQWLAKNYSQEKREVRIDPFQGFQVNPIDLAREYDRYICKESGLVFFSRQVPASDYPSGEDINSRQCPSCGKYIWHSPYIFKSAPVEGELPLPIKKLERLWSLVKPHVRPLAAGAWLSTSEAEGDHFEIEGIQFREPVSLRREDDYGIDENSFRTWLNTAGGDPDLVRYLPRFRTEISYFHIRSTSAATKFFWDEIGM